MVDSASVVKASSLLMTTKSAFIKGDGPSCPGLGDDGSVTEGATVVRGLTFCEVFTVCVVGGDGAADSLVVSVASALLGVLLPNFAFWQNFALAIACSFSCFCFCRKRIPFSPVALRAFL